MRPLTGAPFRATVRPGSTGPGSTVTSPSVRAGATHPSGPISRPAPAWLLVALLVPLGAGPRAAAEADALRGWAVVRVRVSSPAEMCRLAGLVRDVWTEHPHDGFVDALASPAERAAIERSGFDAEVVVDDVAGLLAARGGPRARAPASDLEAAGRDFFARYRPYDEIVAYLRALADAHPRLASLVEIGTTVEGRPILGLRITARPRRRRNPTVAVWAGQHAREWITTMIPPYLASRLLEGRDTDPAQGRLLRRVEWLLVPVVNVDGYVHTWSNPTGPERLWRKNRRDTGGGVFGVDLNRNWPTGWDDSTCGTTAPAPGASGSCASMDPTSEVYRGPAPFSEPETRALRDQLLRRRGLYAAVDLHSFAQLIMWPNGFTSELVPDDRTLRRLGSRMRDLVFATHGMDYGTGPLFSTIYPARGVASDWTYHELGALSFTVEVRPPRATSSDDASAGFLLPEDQIVPTVEEVAAAIRTLGESRDARRFSATRRVVPGVCRADPRRCARRP